MIVIHITLNARRYHALPVNRLSCDHLRVSHFCCQKNHNLLSLPIRRAAMSRDDTTVKRFAEAPRGVRYNQHEAFPSHEAVVLPTRLTTYSADRAASRRVFPPKRQPNARLRLHACSALARRLPGLCPRDAHRARVNVFAPERRQGQEARLFSATEINELLPFAEKGPQISYHTVGG